MSSNKSKKILVVDDEVDILELLKYNLKKEGYNVKTVTNGVDAVETAKDFFPDLVLLDIMMPHLDGYSILKRMKDQKSLAKVPVIIYTGKSFPIDEKKARDLGADSYLVKPVKGSVIVEEVKKYI